MYQSVAKNQIGFLDHVLKAKSAGPHVQQAVYRARRRENQEIYIPAPVPSECLLWASVSPAGG